jgi:hypothetical protein
MIQRALIDEINSAIVGTSGVEQWLLKAPDIRRHVFDTPRRRIKHSHIASQYNFHEAAIALS